MYHVSPRLITSGMINEYGISSDCLFFSNDVYVMTSSDECYIYEADFNCVNVSRLYDDESIDEIAEYFGCSTSLAESLLDGSESPWDQGFECCGEDSWWLQGKRGECAVKMGFDVCRDVDEQGTVYIVPMFGREHELKLIEVCK